MDKYPILGLNLGNAYKFYHPKDILYCESVGNYTTVFFLEGNSTVTARKLKELEMMLPENTFVRVHNSFIVNLMYVVKFINDDSQVLEMVDGSHINVSRRKKSYFLSKFVKL